MQMYCCSDSPFTVAFAEDMANAIEVDVAIIGAGAAGIAAADWLCRSRRKVDGLDSIEGSSEAEVAESAERRQNLIPPSVVILEAQKRIGGRCLTDYDLLPTALLHLFDPQERERLGNDKPLGEKDYATFEREGLELGAEFIHGENTSTKKMGWDTLPAPRSSHMWIGTGAAEGRDGGGKRIPRMPARRRTDLAEEEKILLQSFDAAYDKLAQANWKGGRRVVESESAMRRQKEDLSLADYLRESGVTDPEHLRWCDTLYAQTMCADIEHLSSQDTGEEMKRDVAGKSEFRIARGYSRVLSEWVSDLKGVTVAIDDAVVKVHKGIVEEGVKEFACDEVLKRSGLRVALTTVSGRRYIARHVLCTVSIGVLQSKTIEFVPQLPPNVEDAIQSFRMEGGTKLIYVFRGQVGPADLVYMTDQGRAGRWWTSSYGRSKGAWTVYMDYSTASRSDFLDDMVEEEALRLGLEELAELIATPLHELQTSLANSRRVCWKKNPYTRGKRFNIILKRSHL